MGWDMAKSALKAGNDAPEEAFAWVARMFAAGNPDKPYGDTCALQCGFHPL